MRKLFIICGASVVVTFSLFVVMASLISNERVLVLEPQPTEPVTVMQTPEQSQVENYKRVKLTPPTVKPKPAPINETIMDTDPLISTVNFEPPTIALTNTFTKSTFSGPKDAGARPIFRVNPSYPIKASRDGIEGWVVLGFDINKIGQVTNIKILDAMPKRIFNKAAKQALRKWKYQAKVVDGKQVIQSNMSVQLDFKMDQST